MTRSSSARSRIDESSTLDAQRTALDKVKRRTGKLIELITEDDAPVQAMKAELRALEATQIELEKTLASAQAPAPLIHPALAEIYRQHVAALQDALRDPDSRDEAFEIIRSLIDEIRLVPEDGALKIELRGELAGILALAAESTKARGLSTTGLAEQIKMVADPKPPTVFDICSRVGSNRGHETGSVLNWRSEERLCAAQTP